MADGLKLLTKMTLTSGSTTKILASRQHTVMQSTAATSPLYDDGERTVPTTHAAIPLGGLTTPGEIYIENRDSTNFLRLGTDDSGNFVPGGIKIGPGRDARFPVDSALTLYWEADTAPVKAILGIAAD